MRPTGRDAERRRPATTAATLVEIGRIVGRHGIRGEVRLRLHNPDSTTLQPQASVVLCADGVALGSRLLLGVRRHKHYALLRLDGVTTADDAEALVGRVVCVPREHLPPRGPDEVYHLELIGCTVRTDTGESLGIVERVFATGSNDVCVVADGEREYLIPLIADVVVRIDVDAREMTVHPVPGLLES